MRRRATRTNIEAGTNRGDGHGQFTHWTRYCPKCHRHGDAAHDAGCPGSWTRVSPTAQIPRRTSSARAWRLFNEKFVDRREEIIAAARARTQARLARILSKAGLRSPV